jgi:hypothetical protein
MVSARLQFPDQTGDIGLRQFSRSAWRLGANLVCCASILAVESRVLRGRVFMRDVRTAKASRTGYTKSQGRKFLDLIRRSFGFNGRCERDGAR